jgi:hypothetical protein
MRQLPSSPQEATLAGLKAGALTASVTSNGQARGAALQVATVAPVVTATPGPIRVTATTPVITGFGFSTTAANNTVAFQPAVARLVTAATATPPTASTRSAGRR